MAGAQSPVAMAGVGSHGYDWMIGTWSCKNTIPTALAGPANQTLTVTRSNMANALMFRYTGTNYDQAGYITYSPSRKTWWYSWSYPGGSAGNESSSQTGAKTKWAGMIFDAGTGKPFQIRDTYTVYSMTKFNDSGEDMSSGSWKEGYNGTCTKT